MYFAGNGTIPFPGLLASSSILTRHPLSTHSHSTAEGTVRAPVETAPVPSTASLGRATICAA